MLIKPLYDAYLATTDANEAPIMTPAEFLCQPYQIRLNLAKAKIRIKADFPSLHILAEYQCGSIYNIPEVELGHYRQYSLLSDRRMFLSWDDVHLIPVTTPGDFCILFPFEYDLILPEYDKA